MADQPSSKPAFAGFNLAEDLREFETVAPAAPRARPDAASLNLVSERAGFPSREPRPAAPTPAAAPTPVREARFETRLTLRITERDKQRFDDLAYRLRVANGEVFQRLLDHFEALETKR
jgi:hypothetical protein